MQVLHVASAVLNDQVTQIELPCRRDAIDVQHHAAKHVALDRDACRVLIIEFGLLLPHVLAMPSPSTSAEATLTLLVCAARKACDATAACAHRITYLSRRRAAAARVKKR